MATPPLLPYDVEVDTWGNRMIDIDDQVLTYEEACKHDKYVDIALGIENPDAATDRSIPIEFTQFVLRKMAANKKGTYFMASLVHPKAKQYFMNLIGNRTSEITHVHPPNDDETPSSYRGILTNVFCTKLIMNLKRVEDRYYDKFARVFPFVICKDVSDYNVPVLNCYDDSFYQKIQQFLDEHFDNVEARQITKLFLNNIRKFLKEKPSNYLDTFPRLNEEGIERHQKVLAEYRNIRRHFNNFSLPNLYYENSYEHYKNLPEKNIDDLSYLLQSINFRRETKTYINTFTKYLFFFVHALNENPNEVIFIDDVIYHCLRSLKKYKTVEEDINMIKDIASIALLDLVKETKRSRSVDKYCVSSSALEDIKTYITEVIRDKDVRLNVTFDQFDVTGETFIVVGDAIFLVHYSRPTNNCPRGIRNFFDNILVALLSPDDNPIRYIIMYNAFTGDEKKFSIPEDLRASLRNFIRLSIKNDRASSGWSFYSLMASFENFLI